MARSKKPEPGKQLTVRLKQNSERFKRLQETTGKDDQEIGWVAIDEWIKRQEDPAAPGLSPESKREIQESLQENLVSAVIEHLRGKPEWAQDVLKAAGLMDPVFSIYMQRKDHFRVEKNRLSQSFLPWLVERIIFYLAQSRDVCLVVESGTTLKAALDEIGPRLVERAEDLKAIDAGRLQIITNNFPGAESYEVFADNPNHKLGEHTLNEVVPCDLVPGTALQQYSAVVGRKAQDYLENRCAEIKGRNGICIGLAVGNWVMLEGSPALPTPLARGEGHKSFKEAVLSTCDEVFLISPLCKIILASAIDPQQSLKEFNADFRALKEVIEDEYERVELPKVQGPSNGGRVKLVTTVRENPSSIVRNHSLLVVGALRADRKPTYAEYATQLIENVPHLIYQHDLTSDELRTRDEQLKVELPHKHTRTWEFAEKYFHIRSEEVPALAKSRRSLIAG